MLFNMIFKKHPYVPNACEDINSKRNVSITSEFLKDPKRNDYKVKVSNELVDLLDKMLCNNFKERISVSEALSHKWF